MPEPPMTPSTDLVTLTPHQMRVKMTSPVQLGRPDGACPYGAIGPGVSPQHASTDASVLSNGCAARILTASKLRRLLFFLLLRRPPRSTHFPYTTLCRLL